MTPAPPPHQRSHEPTPPDTEGRLRRWESRTTKVLTALAVLFLIVYAVPIIWPGLPAGWHVLFRRIQDVIWAAFLIDYGTRLVLAPDKWGFVKTHPIDLAAVALPALRPLRLVAALALIHQQAGARLRGHVTSYVSLATGLVLIIASLAVVNAEREAPDASITTWGEGMWWAVTTITTVGYGDLSPVTAEGRWYAVALMMCGIALLGIVTATLASWLIERIRDVEDESRAATAHDIRALSEQIEALRAEVAALKGPPSR